jgi:hypothetical protein
MKKKEKVEEKKEDEKKKLQEDSSKEEEEIRNRKKEIKRIKMMAEEGCLEEVITLVNNKMSEEEKEKEEANVNKKRKNGYNNKINNKNSVNVKGNNNDSNVYILNLDESKLTFSKNNYFSYFFSPCEKEVERMFGERRMRARTDDDIYVYICVYVLGVNMFGSTCSFTNLDMNEYVYILCVCMYCVYVLGNENLCIYPYMVCILYREINCLSKYNAGLFSMLYFVLFILHLYFSFLLIFF